MIRPSKENKSRCKQQQQAQTKTSADRQPGGSNGTGAQKKSQIINLQIQEDKYHVKKNVQQLP